MPAKKFEFIMKYEHVLCFSCINITVLYGINNIVFQVSIWEYAHSLNYKASPDLVLFAWLELKQFYAGIVIHSP